MDSLTQSLDEPNARVDSAPARNKAAQPNLTHLDALEEQIEITRSKTIKTIQELQRRLSLDKIVEQAQMALQDETIGKAIKMAENLAEKSKYWGSSVLETIRQNPIPSLMVGGGLAWMIADRMRGNGGDGYDQYYDEETAGPYYQDPVVSPYDYQTETYAEMPGIETGSIYGGTAVGEDETTRKGSEAAAKGIAKARQSLSQVREKAGAMTGQIRQRASQTGMQVRDRAADVRQTASDYGRRTWQSGRRVKQGFFQQLEQNPMAVAGILFAAGAAIGFVMPETRRERETLGPTRDRFLDRAQDVGRDQMERVQEAARKAADSATETAKSELKREPKTSQPGTAKE